MHGHLRERQFLEELCLPVHLGTAQNFPGGAGTHCWSYLCSHDLKGDEAVWKMNIWISFYTNHKAYLYTNHTLFTHSFQGHKMLVFNSSCHCSRPMTWAGHLSVTELTLWQEVMHTDQQAAHLDHKLENPWKIPADSKRRFKPETFSLSDGNVNHHTNMLPMHETVVINITVKPAYIRITYILSSVLFPLPPQFLSMPVSFSTFHSTH